MDDTERNIYNAIIEDRDRYKAETESSWNEVARLERLIKEAMRALRGYNE